MQRLTDRVVLQSDFTLVLTLLLRRRHERRVLIGACFAFLFQFGVMFALHVLAIGLGWWWWCYGGTALKLLGFPADIWLGGAILWGPEPRAGSSLTWRATLKPAFLSRSRYSSGSRLAW